MKKEICIEDIKIKKDDHTTIFYRDQGFQIIGNSTIGCGIDYVKSIVHHGLKNRDAPLPYKEGEVSREEINNEKEEYLKASIFLSANMNPHTRITNLIQVILCPNYFNKWNRIDHDWLLKE